MTRTEAGARLLAPLLALAVLPGCSLASGQVEPADRPLARDGDAWVLQDGDVRARVVVDPAAQPSRNGTPVGLQLTDPALAPACAITNVTLDRYEADGAEAALEGAAANDDFASDEPAGPVRAVSADDGGRGAARTYIGATIDQPDVITTLVAVPAGDGVFAVVRYAQNARPATCGVAAIQAAHDRLLEATTLPA